MMVMMMMMVQVVMIVTMFMFDKKLPATDISHCIDTQIGNASDQKNLR